MNLKKFAALFLALVLSVTMLTACGGGDGVSENAVNLGQINTLLDQQGVDVDVLNSDALNQAVKTVASTMVKLNNFDTTVASTLLAQQRNYPIVNGEEARIGVGVALSKQDLGATSLEQLVAACIQSLDKTLIVEGYDDYVECYYVSATTVTSITGVVYYVVGVEAKLDLYDE